MSALARMTTSVEVANELAGPIEAGELAVCGVLALEAGYSARNAVDHSALLHQLDALPWVDITPADWRRALDVQQLLARRGHHRSAKLPDLILAAAAERAGLTVLHYDSDFETIAEVSGQQVAWVVPRGSVP